MSLLKSLLSIEHSDGLTTRTLESGNVLQPIGEKDQYGNWPGYQITVGQGKVAAVVDFQHGPLAEGVTNGVFVEDVLQIAACRLDGYQSTPFACSENEIALRAIKLACLHLKSRTKRREDAGIEGTNETDPLVAPRLIAVCQDDYDDGIAWYVLRYMDGATQEHKRQVPEGNYELLSKLFESVLDPEVHWELVLRLTTPVE